MNIAELRQLAERGELRVSMKLYRTHKVHKKYWDMTRLGEWRENPDTELVERKVYSYEARTLDMDDSRAYKLTKRDYLELSPLCASTSPTTLL